MSRSFKKTYKTYPCVKDSASKSSKRLANKKVRHTKDISNGGSYKKCYESYDISDYKWSWTRQEAIDEYNNMDEDAYLKKKYKTLEKYLIYWEKCVKRK